MSVIFTREVDLQGRGTPGDRVWITPISKAISHDSPLSGPGRLGTTASLSAKRDTVSSEGHTRGNGRDPLARKPVSETERS